MRISTTDILQPKIILCAWLLMRFTWWKSGCIQWNLNLKKKKHVHVVAFGVLLALTSSDVVCQYLSIKNFYIDYI